VGRPDSIREIKNRANASAKNAGWEFPVRHFSFCQRPGLFVVGQIEKRRQKK
jgi:hypothetical protein